MTSSTIYITEETKDLILRKANLENLLNDYHSFTKKGTNLLTTCPICQEVDRLNFSPGKSIVKCFKCDIGVNNAVNYLQKFHNLDYYGALEELARIEGISINDSTQKNRRKANTHKSYLERTLAESGLSKEDVSESIMDKDGSTKNITSYQSGTIDAKGLIVPGDDLIIHYYDLMGDPMNYYELDRQGKPKGTAKPFFRIRYQNPSLHKNKYGKPAKYKSPYGSGSKLYINKDIREKYKSGTAIETLYIQEGEKKADKASKHGLPSVGIMGIHNLASKKELPQEFEEIIRKCKVENVVFVLDQDWQDLSSKLNSEKSADQRPRSFFRAVLNFRDYFVAFKNDEIYLNIYFAYVKDNPENDKGIDDLLVNSLRHKESDLQELCSKAINNPNGDAKWLQFHKISTLSDYKIRGFWHLEDINKFSSHYKDTLATLPKFKFNGREYRINEEGSAELAQPLLPEETFWNKDEKTQKISFNHKRCYLFLSQRGFFRLSQPGNNYIFIKVEDNIVTKVKTFQIKDFVMDFTKNMNNEKVENMLHRGSSQYFGENSLSSLPFKKLDLEAPTKSSQRIYFTDCYLDISNKGIKLENLKKLTGQIWHDSIIPFSPSKTELLIREVHKVTFEDAKDNPDLSDYIGEYSIDFSESGNECDFLRFLLNTSIFFGKSISLEEASFEERFETTRHLLSKITAFGYMLHKFRNKAYEKAVVGMDGSMSEVGNSNGRSGKSLFGVALEHLTPTVTIPGKKRDLLDDRFLFQEVDQRTGIIFFDDVRANFDFEFLFPFITGKFTTEKKNMGKTTLPPEFVQKFYIATNHALKGSGGSFEDRQFLLGFSDWYNSNHKPIDDFGKMFFDEWDDRQWNLFYNFAAMSLHFYFKYGLIKAPTDKLTNRKFRQEIGESFLDWAEEYFSNTNNLNTQIYKDLMYQGNYKSEGHTIHGDGYITKYPTQKNYTPIHKFKKNIKTYCKYKGYEYNPTSSPVGGKDIKKNGKEYIEVFVSKEIMENLMGNDNSETDGNIF